jgi:hypothetical protein
MALIHLDFDKKLLSVEFHQHNALKVDGQIAEFGEVRFGQKNI